MKIVQNTWPWLAFSSIIVCVVTFIVDNQYVDAGLFFLIASTYTLILWDIHASHKRKLNVWGYMIGAMGIVSFVTLGITKLM